MKVALITKYGTIESIDKAMPFYGRLATFGVEELRFGTTYASKLPSITFSGESLAENDMILIIDDQQYVLTAMMLSMITFNENECYKIDDHVLIHRQSSSFGVYNIAVDNSIEDIKGFRFIPSEAFLSFKFNMQYETYFRVENWSSYRVGLDGIQEKEDTIIDKLNHVHINVPALEIKSTLKDAVIYTTPPYDQYRLAFENRTIQCDFGNKAFILLPETPVHFEYLVGRYV